MEYKQSGVDIDAGSEVVRRIRSLARGTVTPANAPAAGRWSFARTEPNKI